MNKKTIRESDVAGKRALVRVDFNVPLDAQGHITGNLVQIRPCDLFRG